MFQMTLLQKESIVQNHKPQREVGQLLKEFEDVFAEPKSLPSLDHEIHLLPNLVLVNVRPYRYPHFQKG